MNEIEREVSIEQVDYNVDINDINYTIEIDAPKEYILELNEQGPQGLRGFTGNGISSYELTSTSGLVDTYTITFTDGETTTVNVTNGRGISSITGPVSVENVDTYTINFNDGTTSTFTVTNGIDGINPTITVGSTTTGTPGSNASVVNSGTAQDMVLDFTIPRGEKGEQGIQGEQGPQGIQGPQGATGADGFSPTATVTKSGDTATITITDKNGTTTTTISDGSGASSVSELTDVDLTGLSNGDVLVYDSTSQEWKAEAQSGGVDLVAGTDLEIVPLLPSGHIQLKSITANGSQYINTGIWSTDNFKAEIVGRFTNTTGSQCVLGASAATSNATYKNLILAKDASKYFVNNGNPWTANQTNSSAPLDTNRHTFVVEITASSTKISVDSTTNTGSYTNINTDEDLFLFARNAVNSNPAITEYAQFELESIKLYNNSELVFNGIPDKYGNRAGLYDTVSETFMPSLSATDFVAGEEVANQSVINFTNESRYIKSAAVSTLTDVTLANLVNGQGLIYNSATQKWENQTIQSGGGDVTDVEVNGESVVTDGVASIDLSGYQEKLIAGNDITITPPVVIRVPSGYSQLEYISAIGSSVIVTNLQGAIQWEIDAVGTPPYPAARALVATSTTGSSFIGDRNLYWGYGTNSSSVRVADRATIIVNFNANDCNGTINDYAFSFSGAGTLNKKWALFGLPDATTNRFYGNMYSAKARQNGVLVFDGVPARRDSDNAVGLYDLVEDVFYPSSATAFTAGDEVYDSPSISANVGKGVLSLVRYNQTLANFNANSSSNVNVTLNPTIQTKEVGTGSIINSGTTKTANSLLYCGTDNLIHSYTESANYPISLAYGMFVNNTALSADIVGTWYYKGEKLSWTVPTALRGFQAKQKIWARCTYPDSNGVVKFNSIIGQNNTTNVLAGGYTYYYLGIAYTSSIVALDTTGSHFLSIDTDGKLTHIDGIEITIPTVNNGALTITQDGNTLGTFTANQSENTTVDISGGGSSRDIGEIVASTIPLTDAGLHLLDGTLVSGDGIYSNFVDYVQDLYIDTSIPDGTNWTPAESGAAGNENVRFLNGQFITISGNSLNTSTDGVNWTTTTLTDFISAQIDGIAYGNNKYVALGYAGYISTSTDGVNWTTPVQNSSLGSNAWESVAYGNGKFVAIGRSKHVSTSTDGTTWTTATTAIDAGLIWMSIVYGNGKFVAINSSGYTTTTTDGITWTPATQNSNLGNNSWEAIEFDGTKFVAISYSGYISTSTDGVNWTVATQNSNLGNNNWVGLAYGNGKFIATTTNKRSYSYNIASGIFDTEANWQSAVTTYGVCGKFVYDSVNNTVRLPKITGFVEGASSVSNLGDLVEAGLPNITGWFEDGSGNNTGLGNDYSYTQVNGCFGKTSIGSGKTLASTSASYDAGRIDFDASNSNSIYGNSSSVQPQAIKVLYYIVVATSTKTDIEVDIDEIATDLNGKADVDLTNCTDVADIKMAHNAMPSDRYIDLTLGASGTTYTAPADGYVYFSKDQSGSTQQYAVISASDGIAGALGDGASASGYGVHILRPVKKGTTFQVRYTLTGTTHYFRFIYAVGSESEA